MDRRNFIERVGIGSGVFALGSFLPFTNNPSPGVKGIRYQPADNQLSAAMVIAVGGLGGCAAAFAALINNLSVILTDETDRLGGQLTSQGVPPDEHSWIVDHGGTQLYSYFRTAVRE